MTVIEDFQREVPQDQWDTWAGQYGASAPYFWAAQSHRLQVPPEAQGFFNLPPDQQATWYGVHGENAAAAWLQQSQGGPGGTGAAGSTGGTGSVPPVAKTLLGGQYQGTYGGQTVPGRSTDVGFNTTVAPSTRNPASPGRNAGWGSIGAGTAGIQYGYGGDWRRPGESIKINEQDLPHLSDPKLAPGYIPGSATYNQYDLSKGGLFGQVAGQTVNTRYGLGGQGDPTTGGEVQTPQRWITGNPADSSTAEQGDAAWRNKYGGGGGGLPGTGGGQGQVVNGTGGGENSFFGSTVTSNWGQTPETAGKDYIATLFLRSDTPTGIGTPAYGAPAAFWQGLIEEIRAGRIYVKNPQAWQMLAEKVPGTTPQSIGGAATGGNNAPPSGGAPGTGANGQPINPQFGVGTLPEGADTPFGKIQGGLPQGVGLEYHRILEDRARREAEMALKQAELTGVFNNMPTVAAQELAEKIKQNAFDNAMKTRTEDRAQRQQDLDEAWRTAEMKFKEKELGAKTGYIDGKETVELQEFLAKQQQLAYERAANPAKAFENQWARGATGWNNPGVTADTPGIAGVTLPGQTLEQWYAAGGAGQFGAAPANGPTAATGYQAGTAAMGAPGAPVYGQAQQATQAAQTQIAGAAGQYGQAGQYGGPAPQTAQAQPQTAPVATTAQTAAPAAAPPAQPQAQAAAPQAQTSAQPATSTQNGVTGPAAFLMATPASVQAFRAGAQMPTAGNYGVANAMLGPDQAALSEADVRRQNLKQTRKMAPSVRALIGSYAKGGSVSDEDFKFYGDRKAPGGATAGASYAMK
jgi:hypothetical protein